ncbi:hypothetical protein Tco_0375182 [Tanacetum coccineum]
MEQAGKQQETKYTITSSDKVALKEFDQKRTLFETMTKSKSFDRNPKHQALYHALMESILKDEDAMDKGVVDKKTSKDAEPSKKVKSTDTSEGTTKSQPKSTGKFAQSKEIVFEAGDTQLPQKLGEDMGKTDEPPIVNADPKDWFKKPKRPPTPDPEWNTSKIVDDGPTQNWLSDLAKAEKPSKMLNELMSTPINFTAFAMNHLQISDLTKTYLVGPVYNLLKGTLINVKVNKWYGYGHLEEIEVRRSDQKLYKFMEGDFLRIHLNDIEDMLLLKIVEDLQLGVESYQKKLNISRPLTHKAGISDLEPYTAYFNPEGVIYLDKNIRGILKYSQSRWKSFQIQHQTSFTKDSILQAGNHVKEILLKVNLPDHSDEVLKIKNFKKYDYTSFQDQEKYEHVGPKVTSSQDGKRSQDDDKRLDLADDLKESQVHIQVKLKEQSQA